MDNNIEKNRETMCRACLQLLVVDSRCQKHDIFLTPDLAKKLIVCTSLTVEAQDGFPKYLCHCCFNKVNEFHQFQTMCVHSVQRFSEILQHQDNRFFEFEDEKPNFDFEAPTKLEITIAEPDLLFKSDELEVDMLDSSVQVKRRSGRNMAKTKALQAKANTTVGAETTDAPQTNCKRRLKRSTRQDMDYSEKEIEAIPEKPTVEVDSTNDGVHSEIDNEGNESEANASWLTEDDTPNEQHLQPVKQARLTSGCKREPNKQRAYLSRCKRRYRKRKCERSDSESVRSAKKSEVYQCDVCPMRFFVEHRLLAHKRTHDGLMPYPCSFESCDKGFNRWHCLNEHLKQHEGTNQWFSCSEEGCDKVYKHKPTLSMHLRKFHKKGPELKSHICEICGKMFKASAILNDHRYTHKDKSELPFACAEENCDRRFSSKEKLKVHGMRHAGIKNYVCPYCGMRKTTRNELKIHINYHTLERTWPCRFCQHVCNSAGNLKMHVRTVHERAKDYACRYCERTFAKPDTRKYHEMTHTGEKPNECKECGKRFTQPAALRTHRKIHLRQQAQASKEREQENTGGVVANAATTTSTTIEPTEVDQPTIEAQLQNLLE